MSSEGNFEPHFNSSPPPTQPTPSITIDMNSEGLSPSPSLSPSPFPTNPPSTYPLTSRFDFHPTSSDPLTATLSTEFSQPPSLGRNRKRTLVPSPIQGPRTKPRTSQDQQLGLDPVRSKIFEARSLILEACSLTKSVNEQTKLLDLLEIFREYTEKGQLHSASTIIASQVVNLESATRQIESKAKALARPTNSSNSPNSTTSNNSTNSTNLSSSFATVASNNITRTTSPQEWTLVNKTKPPKKDNTSKIQHKANRLILIKSPTSSKDFSPLAIRNAFNKAFSDKGVKGPVVATVSKTLGHNVVVTTTSTFSAQFLLEKQSIWEHIIQFQSAQKDEPWHKVVLHGIPTADFNTPGGMDLIVEEITTFNKDLVPIGTPYWLTASDKRLSQQAGSVVVAFATANEASRAIRHRLYVAGISVRVEKLYWTASTTQCSKCQGYGHLESYCKRHPRCRLCGESHATQQHTCNTCRIKGSKCAHLVPNCINCKEAHTADFKSCEVLRAIKNRKTTTTL
jgi:hypothetical protein